MICSVCHKELPDHANFCAFCGAKQSVCPVCHKQLPGNANFCVFCGAKQAAAAPAQGGNASVQSKKVDPAAANTDFNAIFGAIFGSDSKSNSRNTSGTTAGRSAAPVKPLNKATANTPPANTGNAGAGIGDLFKKVKKSFGIQDKNSEAYKQAYEEALRRIAKYEPLILGVSRFLETEDSWGMHRATLLGKDHGEREVAILPDTFLISWYDIATREVTKKQSDGSTYTTTERYRDYHEQFGFHFSAEGYKPLEDFVSSVPDSPGGTPIVIKQQAMCEIALKVVQDQLRKNLPEGTTYSNFSSTKLNGSKGLCFVYTLPQEELHGY